MDAHKVVGLYSGETYFTGTLDECENYIAYEQAGSFKIVPLKAFKSLKELQGADLEFKGNALRQANRKTKTA